MLPSVPELLAARVRLRGFQLDDVAFVRQLLNEPSFLQHIGDKGVRTLEDARHYILTGPLASYERLGFGLYVVESRKSGEAMGICGLLKREALDDVDLGFAFLPRFWSQGYAFESASAVLAHARTALGLSRIVAIVSPGNTASIGLLEKLGFRAEGITRLAPDSAEVLLFGSADLRP